MIVYIICLSDDDVDYLNVFDNYLQAWDYAAYMCNMDIVNSGYIGGDFFDIMEDMVHIRKGKLW